jgi:hypothetical protein
MPPLDISTHVPDPLSRRRLRIYHFAGRLRFPKYFAARIPPPEPFGIPSIRIPPFQDVDLLIDRLAAAFPAQSGLKPEVIDILI